MDRIAGAFRQLHVFSQAEGGSPFSGLTALHGTLYGATTHGGTANDGQIFTIDTQGAWSSLYSFQGGTDGAFPSGELTVHGDVLTGVTAAGGNGKCGKGGCGTIYTFAP